MMHIVEAVARPYFTKFISDDIVFKPEESLIKSANNRLADLDRWNKAFDPRERNFYSTVPCI